MRRITTGAVAVLALAASISTLAVPAVAEGVRALFAKNSGRVDGYNAAELVRISGGTRVATTPLAGDGTIVTAEIRIPEPGYVAITASSDASNHESLHTPGCVLAVDGVAIEHSARRVDHYYTAEADCQTAAFGTIAPGDHVVTLEAYASDAATRWGASSLTVVFSPFGPRGSRPTTTPPLVGPGASSLEDFLASVPLEPAVAKRTDRSAAGR